MTDTIIKLLGLIIAGYLFGCVLEVIVAFVVFGSMRYWAGGHHCQTNLGCFSAMLGICFSPMILNEIPSIFIKPIWWSMSLFSILMILLYAPRNSYVNPIVDDNILWKKRIGSLVWLVVNESVVLICNGIKFRWLIIGPLFMEALTISPLFYKEVKKR